MPSLSPELSGRAAALAPDFELHREIGRGGMGVVYLALDVKLDRPVAIKVLPEALAQSSDIRDRFLREGRTAAKLSHPNIVPIYRADEIDGVVFLVMAFVDGPSLGERLSVSGRVPPAETARILRDVALALDYAHSRGVVHRDIKPENVLIDRATQRALVTDFGIARMDGTTPLTQAGQVLGTAHYMSPEHVNGEPVDGRGDLYSLGVVGFRMLTGRLPFDNAMASAVMVAHVTKPAPAVRDIAPDVPASLAAVIDRCLRKIPAERYPSGGALAAALDDALGGTEDHAGAVAEVPVTKSPMLSGDQKEAVLRLAAELQDATGSYSALRMTSPSRPAVGSGASAADQRTLTQGYELSAVQAAAEEALIDGRFVAMAAAQLGLTPGATGSADGAESGVIRPGAPPRAPIRSGTPISEAFLGFPIRVGQTVEVDRQFTDWEWERLVGDLRDTFGATGRMRADGRFREWSNGNLRAVVEPTERGFRVRVQTMNGNALGLMRGGVAAAFIAAGATLLATAARGQFALLGAVDGLGFVGVVGVGMFTLGALRLPDWARRRREQIDGVLERVALPPGSGG